MLFLGTKLSNLKIIKKRVFYRGRYWTLNKPVRSNRNGKRWMVLATKTLYGTERVKLIHFGDVGQKFTPSQCSTESMKNPWHANYWCCKCMTPKKKRLVKTTKKPAARKKNTKKRVRKAA